MGRWGLAIVGLGVAAFGLLVGSIAVTSGSLDCGSAWSPNYSADVDKDVLVDQEAVAEAEAACRDAVSNRRPIAYGVTGFGALLLVAGLTVAQISRPDSD